MTLEFMTVATADETQVLPGPPMCTVTSTISSKCCQWYIELSFCREYDKNDSSTYHVLISLSKSYRFAYSTRQI
jgi:uncharacterized protein YodC (DUF2158 family)